VRAAFHYVRSGRTVTPEVLPGAEDLAALLSPDAERCAGSPAPG
jgi:DNA helicase-2/ATP-dependent DNA helicase PcrA